MPWLVDFNASPPPLSILSPQPVIRGAAAGVKRSFVPQRVQQISPLPALAGPPGSKTTRCWKKLKVKKPIILNGFPCISREIRIWRNEVMKLLFFFFPDQLLEVISCFLNAFWRSFLRQSLSGVRAAVGGSLVTKAYHVSGTARGNLSRHRAEAFGHIRYVRTCLRLSLLWRFIPKSFNAFFFLFCSNPISFFHYCPPESAAVHVSERVWQGRTAAGKKISRRLCSFMRKPQLCSQQRRSVRLVRNYFRADQFINVARRGWLSWRLPAS